MPQLAPSRIELAEQLRTIWSMSPEADTTFEAILLPEYWAHVSAKFRPRDRIEVEPEDGTYYAELIVRDAGKLFAKVEVIRHVKLKEYNVRGDLDMQFDIRHAGPNQKWRVVRVADKAVLSSGHETPDAARSWAMQHAKAMSTGTPAKIEKKGKGETSESAAA